MSIEVMRQALEVLGVEREWQDGPVPHLDAAIAALRAAIEQPREWVELTDDEARALVNRATFGERTNWQALVYMVDAKLKEKNAA
jgi:hypothetical protein